jgi:hypothetical protein
MRVIWTSWAHVWRLHSLFLGTGYDRCEEWNVESQFKLIPTQTTLVHLRVSGGQSLLPLDIVRLDQTLSGIQKLRPTTSFSKEPYKYPSTSNGSLSWPLHSPGAKIHLLHFERPQTLTPRDFTLSSWYRDWVKPRKLVLAIESLSSTLFTLGALLLDG